MERRRSILVDGPARRRLREFVALVPPSSAGERVAVSELAALAAVEAKAPQWVRHWFHPASADGCEGAYLCAWTATAAWLRGYRRAQWAVTLYTAGFLDVAWGLDITDEDVDHAMPCEPPAGWTVAMSRGRRTWSGYTGDNGSAYWLARPSAKKPGRFEWALPRAGWDIDEDEDEQEVDPDEVEALRDEWWGKQTERRDQCMRLVAVLGRPGVILGTSADGLPEIRGTPPLMTLIPCGRRVCPMCGRRSMRREIWRYAPLFAVEPRPGWALEMFTVGSRLPDDVEAAAAGTPKYERPPTVETADDYDRWRRCIKAFIRTMQAGSVECAIAPDTWLGGLTVVELVPRRAGGFIHAHIVAVRRAFYAYGWPASRWRALGAPERPKSGWTPDMLAPFVPDDLVDEMAARYPGPPALPARWRAAAVGLGARELCRRAGLGDVLDAKRLRNGADGVKQYISKVQTYISKTQKGDPDAPEALEARADLMWLVKGKRRLQPFGVCRRLFGGPDMVSQPEKRWLVGIHTLEAVESGDPDLDLPEGAAWRNPETDGARERVTWLDRETLESWRAWADVDALYRRLGVDPSEARPPSVERPPEPCPEPANDPHPAWTEAA